MTQLEQKSPEAFVSKWAGRIAAWASYYASSRTIYQTQHSSVLDFYTKVLRSKKRPQNAEAIESYRQKFSESSTSISTKNKGAGSFLPRLEEHSTISKIARFGISPPWKCQILSQLIAHRAAGNILELGTSLGIMTAYLASAVEKGSVTTIDSNPSMITFSKSWHQEASIGNIQYLNMDFDKALDLLQQERPCFDLIFLDGHHDGGATKQYLDTLLNLSSDDAVIVLDDVLWSADMYRAWKEIRDASIWKASVQYGDLGFLFREKHPISAISIDLIPYRYKPWQIGIFQF